jgi:hypothetical protein
MFPTERENCRSKLLGEIGVRAPAKKSLREGMPSYMCLAGTEPSFAAKPQPTPNNQNSNK